VRIKSGEYGSTEKQRSTIVQNGDGGIWGTLVEKKEVPNMRIGGGGEGQKG